jgi:hypothetical protein
MLGIGYHSFIFQPRNGVIALFEIYEDGSNLDTLHPGLNHPTCLTLVAGVVLFVQVDFNQTPKVSEPDLPFV